MLYYIVSDFRLFMYAENLQVTGKNNELLLLGPFTIAHNTICHDKIR
jgi:hypothetical protein